MRFSPALFTVGLIMIATVLAHTFSPKKDQKGEEIIVISKVNPPFSKNCPTISINIEGGEHVLISRGHQRSHISYRYHDNIQKITLSCLNKVHQEIGTGIYFIKIASKDLFLIPYGVKNDHEYKASFSTGPHPTLARIKQ